MLTWSSTTRNGPIRARNMKGMTPLQAFKKGLTTKPQEKEAAMQKTAA